ncbi:MAG: mandelate racemase, partial [Chloroflexi bacterium]|nr:mandelate racemase [Chloroflexota bacterium]
MSEATGAAIERIEVFGYELSYAHGDYVMSSGREIRRLPSTVVRITTRDGAQGFGEVCPLGSTYLPAFGEGARVALREIAPALIGADATNLADIHRRMDGRLRGHEYAKSALDVACWDVFGRLVGKPVAALLGGALQAELPLYVAIPLGTPDRMA